MDARERRSQARPESPITRLDFDIPWPPDRVAAYLIEEPAPVLVDAGTPSEDGADEMRETLAAEGYEPGDIAAVIVTHPHTDHTGQATLFVDAGVPVYAPRPAIEQLDRDEADLEAGVRSVGRSIGMDDAELEREVERACDSLTRNRRLLDPEVAVPYEFDGTFTVADVEFEPIHTPGHQVHHASLSTAFGDERVLFSGDALIAPFRAAALNVGLDYGAYDSVDDFYASMDRYEGRAVDVVFPGHGPVFTDYEGAISDTRSKLDALVADTLAAVETVGPATPLGIVHERVGEWDHPAKLLDTVGSLGTLERRGEVDFETDDGVRYYDVA